MSYLYEKFNKAKIFLSILFLSVYLFITQISGGSILEVFLFIICFIFSILAPGFVLYKIFKIEKYIKDFEYPLVFTFGCGFLGIIYAISVRLSLHILMYTLIALAVFSAVYILIKEDYISKFKKIDKTQFIFLFFIFSALIFVYAFMGVSKNAHPTVVGEINLGQDFLWNVGNAESFKLNFPPIDIRFFDVRLKYHYLTELLVSAFSYLSGISSYNIIGFYSQLVFLFSLIITLYLFTKNIYNSIQKSNIFILCLFFLSCLSLHKVFLTGQSLFGHNFLSAVLTNVNSMCVALIFLCVFILLFITLTENEYKLNIGYFFVLVGSFILLTYSKSPIAAIVAIALVACLVARFLQGKFILKEVLFTLGLSLGFLWLYTIGFSSGANVSTGFSFSYTIELSYFSNYVKNLWITHNSIYFLILPFFMLFQTFCMMPFTFTIFIFNAFKSVFSYKNLSYLNLFSYAVGIGGMIAYFFSYHEAYSQVYFFYIAFFFITLVAVDKFEFKKLNIKNAPLYILLILSLLTSIFFYLNFTGSGLRQVLYNHDIIQKYPYPYIVKAEDELAGEYLKGVNEENAMFITNRTHTGASEGLSNVYTAFSGMQSYMEGHKYTLSNMGVSIDIIGHRYSVINTIFSKDTSLEDIIALCKDNNIMYIVYSSQFEGDTQQLEALLKVFNDDTVTIYKAY